MQAIADNLDILNDGGDRKTHVMRAPFYAAEPALWLISPTLEASQKTKSKASPEVRPLSGPKRTSRGIPKLNWNFFPVRVFALCRKRFCAR
jgi:hypothetical protein